VTIVAQVTAGVTLFGTGCDTGVANISDEPHVVTIVSSVEGVDPVEFTLAPGEVRLGGGSAAPGDSWGVKVDGERTYEVFVGPMSCGPTWYSEELTMTRGASVLTGDLHGGALVNAPLHGTVKAASDQLSVRWRYTPNPCFIGTDYFAISEYIDSAIHYYRVTVTGTPCPTTTSTSTSPAGTGSTATRPAQVLPSGGGAAPGPGPGLAATGVDLASGLRLAGGLFVAAGLLLWVARRRRPVPRH